MTAYRSPISPGHCWYEVSCGERPRYRPLDGARRADVAIIGGGYTGLAAAYHLAQGGADVVLLEAHRLGDGASGRNGGQLSSGQRRPVGWFEARFGLETARAFWQIGEAAKNHAQGLIETHGIDCDLTWGHLDVLHKRTLIEEAEQEVAALAERYAYEKLTILDRDATAAALGSGRYHGGVRDAGAGHLHPMKFLIGLGRAAAEAGAAIHEETPVSDIASSAGQVRIATARGTVTADRALVAVNAHYHSLARLAGTHVMAIRSFIGATAPLPADSPVLPGRESVADSRFVIRYFRKSADNRLLFGGREAYAGAGAGAITRQIRRQMTEVYPGLAATPISHAWGGAVAITVPRLPFVREMQPGVLVAGGFSGHGVALAPYVGKLAADGYLRGEAVGDDHPLSRYRRLPVQRFPGGVLRQPLMVAALSFYALRDRFL